VGSDKTVTTNNSKFGEFNKIIKELTAGSKPTAASTNEKINKCIAEPMLLRTSDPQQWWNNRKA
jgi:hypothetical protein